jgi:NitT/TauT family transport system substrate-binding protein
MKEETVKRTLGMMTALGLLASGLSACAVGGAEASGETVVIGYQSKTINTVTAGTLLRDRGFFEKRLKELDPGLQVEWQD